ncbi:MAG: IS110 family transposase [Dongiaceae bacterium]
METRSSISHMGWDSHRAFSKVTARDGQNRVVWRRRVDHRDRGAMRKLLRSWPTGTPVILESTFGWGWISDELREAGLSPHLANSRKVAGWRDARGLAKSDRMDADLLSELWTQQPHWWKVWLAPPEVRQCRELMRYRMSLVQMQTGIKNRLHAVLHRHGILHDYSDLFGAAGRRFLQRLAADEQALPKSARLTLKGLLQLLDHVRRQIAGAVRVFRGHLEKTPAGDVLMSLPGVGRVLAYTMLAEIGCIERFAGSGHLMAYSLLAPRARDSGQDEYEEAPQGRRIGQAGRRTLKWAWIEAAHGAVRSGGRFRELFDRMVKSGKSNGRAYIVVAHELCRLGYVLLSKHVRYSEHRPERPGSSRSRPGTGQPVGPMVVGAWRHQISC